MDADRPTALAPPETYDHLDALSANVIRGLVMDAIQQAGVGHPGMPMGMADVATVLWTRFLRHDPADPRWLNRDRLVLSAGHGAMLLYSVLHLSGYDLPLEQLKRHRQLHSMTPGHPEHGRTPGVETTTGPLGQGFATAAGMALAEALLAATFNRPGYPVEITSPTASPATATWKRGSRTRPRPWPGTWAWGSSSASTTTTG